MDRYNQLIQLLKEEKISEEEYLELTKLIQTGLYEIPYKGYLQEAFESADSSSISDTDTNEVLQRLHHKIGTPDISQTRIVPMWTSRVKQWWLAAAAVSLVVMSTFWWVNKQEVSKQDSIVQYPETFEFTGKDYVRLPDGSTVWLKEGTRISYERSFGRENREVTLFGGEAFFDVAHNAAKPFTVRTGKVITTVLGTAFDINASDENITVTVVRGKVAVGNAHRVFEYITPDEQISINTTGDEVDFTKAEVDAADVVAWQNDYFILDRVTIEQAAQMIGERFNTKVTITNEDIKNCIINAWYLNDEVLKDIMDDISTLHQATYTINDGEVIIEGGTGCKK